MSRAEKIIIMLCVTMLSLTAGSSLMRYEDPDIVVLSDNTQNMDTAKEVYAAEVTSDGKININAAESDVLTTLDGIGPSLAERIIEYRTQTPFEVSEDIMKVPGIGQKTFDKIKDKITVQ